MLLDTDRFLNELGKLYERNKTSGSVYCTIKRSNMAPTPKTGKGKATSMGGGYCCLIRATDGRKKLSTVVDAKDHLRFQAAYSVLLKAHMDALKKRDRGEKKKKGKAVAK